MTSGRVWVWLGNPHESDFSVFDYVEFVYGDDDASIPSSHFTSDFGVGWYDNDFQEAVDSAPDCDVETLLAEASYFPSFRLPLLKKAAALGLSSVRVGILIYDEDFSFSGTPTNVRGLRFVGDFPFHD